MEFPLLTPELKEELNLRISKIRLAMEKQHLGAVLIASTVNLFYLTGGVCRGYFYLPIDREPIFFMVPPASAASPMAVAVRKPEQIPEILAGKGYPAAKRIGLEFDDLYYSEVERLKAVFEGAQFDNATTAMRNARQIKTALEIQKMREDGVKQCAVYSRVERCYKEGMSDIELQIEIERVLRKEGNLGYLRVAGSKMEINMGSLLAGPNADEPSPYDFTMGGTGIDPSLPVGASGIIMKPGMTVMVDMNGGFNGYQTDMTRCWYIDNVSDKVLKAHECSRAILRDLEQYARPGVEIGELYRRAVRIAEEFHMSAYFMGHRHKVSFIGHGVGIELNEQPVIMERNHTLLEENMTIALEPKFVLPPFGAVGVENTYVVRAEGLENLTPLREEMGQLV